jgi:molybdenum cofactor cytidylyltransferase
MAVAVVPAAGRSRRMGRPKLLLPAGGGETVVGATVRPLVEGGVERVCVVVGPVVGPGAGPGREDRDAERLRDWALGHGFTVAVNPDPERGMLSSILEGLAALGGADALAGGPAQGQVLLVTPADLPGLRPSTVRSVLRARAAADAALAVPVVALGGPSGRRLKRGHPLAIAPRLLHEVAELDLAVGLRQLLDRHPDEILEVPVDDPGCVHDVDTPEDYRRVATPRRSDD